MYFEENDVWEQEAGSSEIYDYQIQYILRDSSGSFTDLSSDKYKLRFSKKMSKLLSDNTILANKIKKKEPGYSYDDLEQIITEYNMQDEVE